MTQKKFFENAWPYQDDLLALPVNDIDKTSKWYCSAFGMAEVRRSNDPVPTVVLERDKVQIGFSINGKDASQDGAAILVTNIDQVLEELKSNGVKTSDLHTEEREGEKLQVFNVVAPDGLCYYFHQAL